MIHLLKSGLFLLFLCGVSIAYSQSAIGVKAGVNLGSWSFGEDLEGEEFGSNLGFQFGGVLEIAVSEVFSFQPELLYFQKGARNEFMFEILGEEIFVESEATFNYIEVPLLAKIKLGNSEATNLFFTVGPSLGYAASASGTSKSTAGGVTTEESEDIELDEEFNRFELSASLGAGVSIPVGSANLFVEARYLLGLSNLVADENSNDETVRNRGIGISAGFMFPFGGGSEAE